LSDKGDPLVYLPSHYGEWQGWPAKFRNFRRGISSKLILWPGEVVFPRLIFDLEKESMHTMCTPNKKEVNAMSLTP